MRRGECTSRRGGFPLLTMFLEEKQMNIRAGKFVHDALREGQRLRAKTWGKKSRCPRKARRDAKREVREAV